MVTIDPRPAGGHARQKSPEREERRGQIAVEVLPPVRLGDLGGRLRHAAPTCEGQEHVDGTEPLLDALPHPVQRGGVGAVGHGGHRAGAGRQQLVDHGADGSPRAGR